MKEIPVCLSSLPCLILFVVFIPRGFCEQRIHCQWGPYGEWSECDGCTKTQTRSRAMVVYAQFRGNPCDGESTQTQPCETTQGCPLEDGCGDRFHCRSGKCVSRSLMCNGDQDCEEDGDDEHVCDHSRRYIVCPGRSILPPNIEVLGEGFDAVTGKRRGMVINTKSFGGQCHLVYSGVHNSVYRLPLSTLQYNFMVKVQSDFSDEVFSSEWHYAKDIVNRMTVTGTTSGYRNYDFHEREDKLQNHRLLECKSDVEVAQFQSNAPQYLPISEEFWKALAKLPTVYNYAAYRKVLERFGTHYVSEGSLGGSVKAIVSINQETARHRVEERLQYEECERTKRWFLFFPIIVEKCDRGSGGSSRTLSPDVKRDNRVSEVHVEGGDIQHIAALQSLDLTNEDKNWEIYTNWADSVRSFPQVIKQKLRPVSELVKEIQCTGVKKLNLRRAIEQYLAEQHPCHCRPCRNNGLAVRDGDECKCICKPGTSGLACERGSEVEGQQGVIHGSWSCWSHWASCSGDRRSRSRSCTNPTPQNGGQHCNGESSETADCEDQDLQYLKTMEPQCFDASLPAREKCGTPPALINGFILDPKDVYLVGSRIEYTCTEMYHYIGNSILECTADQTWSGTPGLCTVPTCRVESISDGITVTPLKNSYHIGEKITLSCPEGRQVLGETEVICDPSLNFSPNPAEIRCSEVSQQKQQQQQQTVQCEQWKKVVNGKCVCRIPFQCTSSLEVCATNPARGNIALLTVCKMHALQCLGKRHNLTEDSACQWPERTTTACTHCQMWETCDDGTSECRCKDSAECLVPGVSVCVRVGEDTTAAVQTMSECEAGLKRCKGEKVSVVSILPCEP